MEIAGTSASDDRWAIQDVVHAYARRIDLFDFDGIATLFADGARIDYGGYPEMRGGEALAAFLRTRTSGNAWHQHLVTVAEVRIDGDQADTITYFVSHAVAVDEPDTVRQHVGEYRDHLSRTGDGWRIVERVQRTGWKETRRRPPA
jgi:hypothetical protein